jgi:UDP-N-acetyl-D-glucosamine dehydrogenase
LVVALEGAAHACAAGEQLKTRIKCREATIGLVGLGYAGLPLAVAFAEAGFSVIGVDLHAGRIDALSRAHSYVGDIASERLAPLVETRRFTARTDYAALATAEAITICVPTPLTADRAPDTSAISAAMDALAPWLREGQLIVLESTSYPGTTEELVRPWLEAQGFTVGQDIFLAFAPERVNPGDAHFGTRNTPKLVGGATNACRDVAVTLYEAIVEDVVPVPTPRVAEMAKLMENTFRAINVALANEMALMCERMGIDVWEVIDAAATKPFGFMPFYPGPGLGGPCIPIVPHYLSWKMKTLGYAARLIALADEINSGMPGHVVGLVSDALVAEGKDLRGARVLVLGVSYKPDVADLRESPAIATLDELMALGADVSYHDPLVPTVEVNGRALASETLDAATLRAADCVVIATNHRTYDWPWIIEHARLIVDTRNATAAVPKGERENGAHIVRLGAPHPTQWNGK